MTSAFTRRAFLAAATSALALPAVAKPPARSLLPKLRPDGFEKTSIESGASIVARINLPGDVGFAVADAVTGEMLETHRADRTLPPASVAKALTASYALDTLGPDHRFATRVLLSGARNGGIIEGDLILAGGGDPTLDTDALARLAAQVKAAGVTELRGRLLVWGGALPFAPVIDSGQPDQVGYNPSVSGLNLNFNRVHFEWRRAGGNWDVTMDARSANFRPAVRVARMEVVSRQSPVYTYTDANGRDNWTVAQGALGNGGARWLPVRKPEVYAGEVFQTFLGAQGIRVKSTAVLDAAPTGGELARVESAPLAVLMQDMLKYSTNLTAEVTGMATTSARSGRPASLRASAQEMSVWARDRLNMRVPALVDHSGLGDKSRICARDMVRAMVAARGQIGLQPLLKTIPVRDDMDCLVKAKTGTLNFVSGLGGYVTTPKGRELAFAVFAADLPRRDGLTRAERERPKGAKGWNTRARTLQLDLIHRWSRAYEI